MLVTPGVCPMAITRGLAVLVDDKKLSGISWSNAMPAAGRGIQRMLAALCVLIHKAFSFDQPSGCTSF